MACLHEADLPHISCSAQTSVESATTKKDVAEHPEPLNHVGLRVNKPLENAECPSSSHPPLGSEKNKPFLIPMCSGQPNSTGSPPRGQSHRSSARPRRTQNPRASWPNLRDCLPPCLPYDPHGVKLRKWRFAQDGLVPMPSTRRGTLKRLQRLSAAPRQHLVAPSTRGMKRQPRLGGLNVVR